MNAIRISRWWAVICLAIIITMAFSGCRILKRTTGKTNPVSEEENVVRKVVKAQTAGDFIEIRLTGKAEEDRNKVSFMGTIKIERDKQIFIMLRTTIGIELARVYANRDSVWIVSKMLSIKEKGDWKLAAGKIGYPVDFYSLQGILLQSLFTSAGDQLSTLISNLVVKSDNESLRLISNTNMGLEKKGINYFNDFLINSMSFLIEDAKLRDINGQWIADVKYLYNKENIIKKIELVGIDSERNFSVEMNIVKKEIKDMIEINFEKF